MLECCGCESIKIRQSSWLSEDPEGKRIIYYPPAVSRWLPQWSGKLPSNEESLLEEVYAALHAGSLRLAMMGARALIDVTLASKVGDQGGFAKTLAEGEKQGYVSPNGRAVLAAAFDAGSAAAHRGHSASTSEVNQVIDIVENLLQNVYVLDSLADNLKKKTPQRKKKTKQIPKEKPKNKSKEK